jgi:hypothetical protein
VVPALPQEIGEERKRAASERYEQFFSRPSSTLGAIVSANTRAPSGVGSHVESCPTCHGLAPLPLPFPFGAFPRAGNSGGEGAGRPDRDFKQCDIQHDRDSEICGGIPGQQTRRECRVNAMKRLAHCLKTGEVGEPNLLPY